MSIKFPKTFLGITEKFNDIQELETQVLNFHKHEVKEVFVKLNGEFAQAKNFKGIYNLDTSEVDGVMTKRYNLIKHGDAILPLVDTIKELGLTGVSGYTFCNGKRAYTMVWFEDVERQVEVQKGDIIKLGILIGNSVDGTLALWGEVMGLRLVCMNGMTTEHIIQSYRKVHLGKENIAEEAGQFYKALIVELTQHSEILKDIVSRNVAEMINSKLYDTILSGIGMPETHVQKILEELEGSDKISKWDLYNKVTEYITHLMAKGSLERRLTFLKSANKILIMETQQFIEMARQRETLEGAIKK